MAIPFSARSVNRLSRTSSLSKVNSKDPFTYCRPDKTGSRCLPVKIYQRLALSYPRLRFPTAIVGSSEGNETRVHLQTLSSVKRILQSKVATPNDYVQRYINDQISKVDMTRG